MALLQVNFVSQTLMRTVPIQVVLPVDKFSWDGARPEGPFPTLYLLHGIFGNYTDWVSGTRIQRWAEEHNLAVVMPSGDNRFYVDQPDTQDLYGEFIGSELVDITRRMFPLSGERANTFIGRLRRAAQRAQVPPYLRRNRRALQRRYYPADRDLHRR